MAKNERTVGEMASVRGDVRERTRSAIEAILALVWEYRASDFTFAASPDIDGEVNGILRNLSDGNLADAEKRAKRLLEMLELEDWEDDSIDYAEREISGENALWRLDFHSSHLKELIEGWIAVAAMYGWSKAKTLQNIWAYLSDPSASKDWRASGRGKPSWGRGYSRDIMAGMTLVGQDIVATVAEYAGYMRASRAGAAYFIRHRNSGYNCPECDSYCEKKLPISAVIFQTHPRCVCYNEYFTEDGKKIDLS